MRISSCFLAMCSALTLGMAWYQPAAAATAPSAAASRVSDGAAGGNATQIICRSGRGEGRGGGGDGGG